MTETKQMSPSGPAGRAHGLTEAMAAYARRQPPRRVAVLGNAPLEPSDDRADAIDAADVVIRVNSFVMDRRGEPRAQGRRVDIVVWNRITRATPFLFADYRQRLYLMMEPMRMHGRPEMWPPSWPTDLGFVVVPNGVVGSMLGDMGLDPETEPVAPTTGLAAAWLAVEAFPDAEILLSGYSFIDDPHQTHWRHQWGDDCPVGPEHRIVAEAAVMSGWLSEGRARLLR